MLNSHFRYDFIKDGIYNLIHPFFIPLSISSRRTIGVKGENIACGYLERLGYVLTKRNYQLKGGEIDIIAQDGDCTVFIEVRYRQSESYGHPLDTFSVSKRRALKRAVFFYLQRHHIDIENARIDFIGIMPKKDGTVGHHLWHIKGVDIF